MKKILILFILVYVSFSCKKGALEPVVEENITGGTLNVTVKDERILPIKVEASFAGKNDYKEIGQINSMGESVEVHLSPKKYDFKFTTLTQLESFKGKVKEEPNVELVGSQTVTKNLNVGVDFIEDTGTLKVTGDTFPMEVYKLSTITGSYEKVGSIQSSGDTISVPIGTHQLKFNTSRDVIYPLGLESIAEVKIEKDAETSSSPIFQFGTFAVQVADGSLFPVNVSVNGIQIGTIDGYADHTYKLPPNSYQVTLTSYDNFWGERIYRTDITLNSSATLRLSLYGHEFER